MEKRFKIGKKAYYSHQVQLSDLAVFEEGMVHPVCSTFALAKHIEWASRIFVLEVKHSDEEGIGTYLHIKHASPALLHQVMQFEATITALKQNELICEVVVKVEKRIIAKAYTGQKIIKKKRLKEIFSSLENNDGKEKR